MLKIYNHSDSGQNSDLKLTSQNPVKIFEKEYWIDYDYNPAVGKILNELCLSILTSRDVRD